MSPIRKITANQVYVLFIIIWGLLFSFLVPPWQTPDEFVHLTNLGAGIENGDMAKLIAGDLELDEGRIRGQYEEKLDKEQWREALTKKPDYHFSQCLPKGLDLVVLKYLPATLGIELGVLLHLPSFWVMQLGELFSLLFYAFLSGLALKLMPVRKNVFMLIMMLPMVIHQAAGIGHDAMVLPLTFLFTAYVLKLKYEAETIGLKQLLLVIALWLLITYIKIPYVFLAGLFLLLPLEKIEIKLGKLSVDGVLIRKWRLPGCAVLLMLAALGLFVGRNNVFIQVVYGMVREWKRTLHLYVETVRAWHDHLLISAVGNFGWLDAPVQKGFAIGILLFAVAVSLICYEKYAEKKEGRQRLLSMKAYDRVIIWGTFFVLTVFTMMSMVNHTIMMTLFGSEQADASYQIREALYQIPYIGGLQGRYFIPFLPLLFLPLPQLKNIEQKKISAIVSAVIVVSAVYSVFILVQRYWV